MYNTMVSSSPRPIVTRLDNNTFPTLWSFICWSCSGRNAWHWSKEPFSLLVSAIIGYIEKIPCLHLVMCVENRFMLPSSSESSSRFLPASRLRLVILCSATRRWAVLLIAWLNRFCACLVWCSSVKAFLSSDSLSVMIFSSRSPIRASVHFLRIDSSVFSASLICSSLAGLPLYLSSTMSFAAMVVFSEAAMCKQVVLRSICRTQSPCFQEQMIGLVLNRFPRV